MSLLRVATVAALVLLPWARNAAADAIVIPLSAFPGNERVVDFSVATTQPLPYTEDGATFLAFTGSSASVLGFNQFLFMAGAGTLMVSFSDPISMAGFNFVNSFGTAAVAAELFADSAATQSLGQVSLGSFAPLQQAFLGFATTDATFARANISFAVPANASFFIDDFRFDGTEPIPEPGTISLTLLGLGLLGSRVRRHLRRALA